MLVWHSLYEQSEIATLYLAGFGSSLIMSTAAGTLADKYGRRNGCLAFTTLQIVCTTHCLPSRFLEKAH